MTRIRAALAAEAGGVADLINAINRLDGNEPPVPMTAAVVLRDLLGPAPKAMLLVAEADQTLVGFATGGEIYDAARAASIVMLLDLYVRPEARRRGIGRALMAGLAALSRRRGLHGLWWGVDVGDDGPMAFYQGVGAIDEGLSHGMLLEGPAFDRLADAA